MSMRTRTKHFIFTYRIIGTSFVTGTYSITVPVEESEDNTDDSTISGIVHKTLKKDEEE